MNLVIPPQSASPMAALAFSPDFFKRKFPKYIKQVCDIGNKTTVLELVLSDGLVVDVTYFEEIDPKYLLVVAFTDSRTCEQVFHSYIRYETIMRVNLINRDAEERKVGFDVEHTPKISNELEE